MPLTQCNAVEPIQVEAEVAGPASNSTQEAARPTSGISTFRRSCSLRRAPLVPGTPLRMVLCASRLQQNVQEPFVRFPSAGVVV